MHQTCGTSLILLLIARSPGHQNRSIRRHRRPPRNGPRQSACSARLLPKGTTQPRRPSTTSRRSDWTPSVGRPSKGSARSVSRPAPTFVLLYTPASFSANLTGTFSFSLSFALQATSFLLKTSFLRFGRRSRRRALRPHGRARQPRPRPPRFLRTDSMVPQTDGNICRRQNPSLRRQAEASSLHRTLGLRRPCLVVAKCQSRDRTNTLVLGLELTWSRSNPLYSPAPNLMSSSPPAQAQHSFTAPSSHPIPPILTFSHPSGSASTSTPPVSSLEDGVGLPPAMKRPRGTGRAAIGVAAGRDAGVEARNATGRNYSNGAAEQNGKVHRHRPLLSPAVTYTKLTVPSFIEQARPPVAGSSMSTSTPAQGGSGDLPPGVRRSSRLSSVTTASVPRPRVCALCAPFVYTGALATAG